MQWKSNLLKVLTILLFISEVMSDGRKQVPVSHVYRMRLREEIQEKLDRAFVDRGLAPSKVSGCEEGDVSVHTTKVKKRVRFEEENLVKIRYIPARGNPD